MLQQSFKKAFPAGSLSAGREVAAPDDAIVFMASGMNRGDAEQFKALVDDALRNVAENGLMAPKADDAFGTDDPATAGDFYGTIYVMAFGTSAAADEAMAMLAQYGLVPEGVEAETELTVGSGAELFSTVTAALGAPWTPEVETGAEEQALTRGQLAQLLNAFMAALQ